MAVSSTHIFSLFCFTDIAVATFSGRILPSRLPYNPEGPFQSGTGKLNHFPLRDDKDEFFVGKSSGGENLIRLRCSLAMFVPRVVRCGCQREWRSELGMLFPALASSVLPLFLNKKKGKYIGGVNLSVNQCGGSLGC